MEILESMYGGKEHLVERVRVLDPWLAAVLPEGWPVHTSTLIAGPAGSGKPFLGNLLAARWLEGGGSVVFMSLQNPGTEEIAAGLRAGAGLDVKEHEGRVAYLELHVAPDGVGEARGDRLRANLAKPTAWDEGIARASALVADEGPGMLLYGVGLHLLLFSPTYGRAVLERMERTIRLDKRQTYLFTVTSTVKVDMVRELERAADNLLVCRSTHRPFRVRLRVERMRHVAFSREEVEVPTPLDLLEEVRVLAEQNHRVIPQVSAL